MEPTALTDAPTNNAIAKIAHIRSRLGFTPMKCEDASPNEYTSNRRETKKATITPISIKGAVTFTVCILMSESDPKFQNESD